MGDFVIDTNVWVMLDKIADPASLTLEEIDCIEACKNWLKTFINNTDRLVIDNQYRILKEYRRNIAQGGQARNWLNRLETQPRERLIEVQIDFDDNGYAIVPNELTVLDNSDKKFAAVALAHNPIPPIVDAVDAADWAKAQPILAEFGIPLIELCSP